jgi:uncharacterized membrane protein YkoI
MRLPFAFAIIASAASPALADRLPEGAIPITEAVSIAEGEGLTAISGADFDDGHWDVEGIDADNREIEIEIDGTTGDVIRRGG